MFGRTVGAVYADLVRWTVPGSGGSVRISVHKSALPAFQQVAANLAAEAAQGNFYAVGPNTYGYSGRTVSGSLGFSRHAFGIAIDINSTKNPYQEGPFEEGEKFTTNMPDWYVKAWADAGFCWGGDWKDSKDPMHFSWQGPGFTPGYGDPAPSYPVKTSATDFVKQPNYDATTFFAGRSGLHLIGDMTGDGAPDAVRAFDKNNDLVIQYVSARSDFAECYGSAGTIVNASVETHEVIVGDFAGYRRTEAGVIDESGPFVSIELLSQRGEPGERIVIDTSIPVRPDQTYVVGDYNWDGTPDIYVIVNDTTSTTVEVWDGAEDYAVMAADFVGLFGDTTGWQFALGDRDLDDRPDLYAFEPDDGGAIVHIYTNAAEMLTVASTIDIAAGQVTVADFDGDGRDDIWMNSQGVSFTAWMGSDATNLSTSWFQHPNWTCPDEWEPFDFEGTFRDDDRSVFQNDIEWLAASGITFGCNPPINDEFCPERRVTRGEMAAFLSRALSLPGAPSAGFEDTTESTFVADIDKLAASGITFGCNEEGTLFCPDGPVTREQMAAFLSRAFGYFDRADNPFTDDDGSIFEPDIERLAAAAVTFGCNPPDNNLFCSSQSVTRGQMAAFLHRAVP